MDANFYTGTVNFYTGTVTVEGEDRTGKPICIEERFVCKAVSKLWAEFYIKNEVREEWPEGTRIDVKFDRTFGIDSSVFSP